MAGINQRKGHTFFCKKCEMQFRGRIIFNENSVCPCCKDNKDVEVYVELLEKEEKKLTYPICQTCKEPNPGRWKMENYWECNNCLHRTLANRKPPPMVAPAFAPPPNLSASGKAFVVNKRVLLTSELSRAGWGIE